MSSYQDFIYKLATRIRKGQKLGKALKEVILEEDQLLHGEAKEQPRKKPLKSFSKDEIPF